MPSLVSALCLTLALSTPLAPLRAMLAERTSRDLFSGVALVATRAQTVFAGAYGDADRALGVKNRIDTKFNIGSMGKMFTGVAVLQLIQAKRLALDETLLAALPDYPNAAVAARITIRELLTHTSGMGDFFGPAFAASNMGRLDSPASLLPFFVDAPLLFAPGSRWQYSNAGYVVLGLVIAHASGESYDGYVQRHIFDVAGMRDTGNWAADAIVPNRAVGYTRLGVPEGPLRSNVFLLQRGGPAGGGYSTAVDLVRFARALQNGLLLDPQYTASALTGQVATTRPGVRYGFGLEVRTLNGTRIVGHSGGGPGIESVLDIYPDTGDVVAILTNLDHAMTPIDDALRASLTGR